MGATAQDTQYNCTTVENTSSYEPIATPTINSPWGGTISFRQKFKQSILRNLKFGIDKKATHKWNK